MGYPERNYEQTPGVDIDAHPTQELREAADNLSRARDVLEDANRGWLIAAKRWDAALNEIERWKHDVAPIDPMAEQAKAAY